MMVHVLSLHTNYYYSLSHTCNGFVAVRNFKYLFQLLQTTVVWDQNHTNIRFYTSKLPYIPNINCYQNLHPLKVHLNPVATFVYALSTWWHIASWLYYNICMHIRTYIYRKSWRLVELKFGESTNISVWWKKFWWIYPKLQVCTYVRIWILD